MQRKQYTFYRSFWEVIQKLPTKSEKLQAFEILSEYALNQTEPDFEAIKPSVAMFFHMVRPVLDTAHKRAEALRTANNSSQIS